MSTTTPNYDSTSDTNALTITLASLATSATLVAGRNSTIVDNRTTKYLDFIVQGQLTTGTTPTTGTFLQVWLYAPLKAASGTFSYPIATTTQLTESDAAATFETQQRDQLFLAASIAVNSTSNRSYPVRPFSVAQIMGLPVAPLKWGIFVTHSTAVNLNSTSGNHWLHWTGIKLDTA